MELTSLVTLRFLSFSLPGVWTHALPGVWTPAFLGAPPGVLTSAFLGAFPGVLTPAFLGARPGVLTPAFLGAFPGVWTPALPGFGPVPVGLPQWQQMNFELIRLPQLINHLLLFLSLHFHTLYHRALSTTTTLFRSIQMRHNFNNATCIDTVFFWFAHLLF